MRPSNFFSFLFLMFNVRGFVNSFPCTCHASSPPCRLPTVPVPSRTQTSSTSAVSFVFQTQRIGNVKRIVHLHRHLPHHHHRNKKNGQHGIVAQWNAGPLQRHCSNEQVFHANPALVSCFLMLLLHFTLLPSQTPHAPSRRLWSTSSHATSTAAVPTSSVHATLLPSLPLHPLSATTPARTVRRKKRVRVVQRLWIQMHCTSWGARGTDRASC